MDINGSSNPQLTIINMTTENSALKLTTRLHFTEYSFQRVYPIKCQVQHPKFQDNVVCL
jgi:hypothetical protein